MCHKKSNTKFKIKENALFLADSHVNEQRYQEFLNLIETIAKDKIKVSQLFLMGDIFDLLIGDISYTKQKNAELIKLINSISEKMDVFYFEGNHDFNLQKVFPKCKVFPISAQPVGFDLGEKSVLLSHGDIYSPFLYKIYTKFIRSKFTLYILNFFDKILKNKISSNIMSKISKKNICKKLESFENIANERVAKYSCRADFLIEGHFHQNMTIKSGGTKYVNLSSFACSKSFFVVQSLNEPFFQEAKGILEIQS